MSVVDQRTGRYGLPLPHERNRLEDDVLRLKSSVSAMDGLLGLLSDRVGLDEPGAGVLTYDGQGRVSSETQTGITGVVRTVTYDYDAEGSVLGLDITVGARAWRLDYGYNVDGTVASTLLTEVVP